MGKRKRDQQGLIDGERGGNEPNREDAVDYLNKVKTQFNDQPEMYNKFLSIMKDFESRRIDIVGVVGEVKELFSTRPDLVSGFNSFLPEGYKIEAGEEEGEVAGEKERDARVYVKKIRNAFKDNPRIYKSFLDILHSYQEERKTMEEVYREVAELFAHRSDLLEEFTNFLPHHIAEKKKKELTETSGGPISRSRKEAAMSMDGLSSSKKANKECKRDYAAGGVELQKSREHAFFRYLRTSIKVKNVYEEFFRVIELFNQQILTKAETTLLVEDILSHYPELLQAFKELIANYDNEYPSPLSPLLAVDLSTCRRYGPSYMALDPSFPQKICSGRDKLSKEVLNDKWISVPSGSEVKMTKHTPYEMNIFATEDERYQLDMLVSWCQSTIAVLEPMNKLITEGSPEEIENEDFLSHLKVHPHLKVIERMYGAAGKGMVAELKLRAVAAIPLILKRLKEKEAEMNKVRREMNFIWSEQDMKNNEKHFEQEGHLFRQLDKKYLRSSNFLEDISSNPYKKYHYEMKDDDVMESITKILLAKAKTAFTESATASRPQSSGNESSAAGNENNGKANGRGNGSHRTQKSKPVTEIEDRNTLLEKFQVFWESFFVNFLLRKDQVKDSDENMKKFLGEDSGEGEIPINVAADQLDMFVNLRFKERRRIFFSDKTFYVFFRLISSLYDRLHKIRYSSLFRLKRLAAFRKNSVSNVSGTVSDAITETNIPISDRGKNLHPFITHTGLSGLRVYSSGNGDVTKKDKSKTEDELAEENYLKYVDLLVDQVKRAVTRDEYEQKCSEIFTDYPFFLYSMDILINKIMKQIKVMFTSEALQKYFKLWYYEKKRSRLSYASYYANAVSITLEETFFKFDVFPESGNGIVQMVTNSVPVSKPLAYEKKWVEYVDNYLNNPDPMNDISRNHVFLKRNVRGSKHLFISNEDILGKTVVRNDVECKICMRTYKLSFLEGKADVFYRERTKKNGQLETSQAVKRRKFVTWLSSKLEPLRDEKKIEVFERMDVDAKPEVEETAASAEEPVENLVKDGQKEKDVKEGSPSLSITLHVPQTSTAEQSEHESLE